MAAWRERFVHKEGECERGVINVRDEVSLFGLRAVCYQIKDCRGRGKIGGVTSQLMCKDACYVFLESR